VVAGLRAWQNLDEIGEWKFGTCYAWVAAYGYFKETADV
jgi:hypothetical protein